MLHAMEWHGAKCLQSVAVFPAWPAHGVPGLLPYAGDIALGSGLSCLNARVEVGQQGCPALACNPDWQAELYRVLIAFQKRGNCQNRAAPRPHKLVRLDRLP